MSSRRCTSSPSPRVYFCQQARKIAEFGIVNGTLNAPHAVWPITRTTLAPASMQEGEYKAFAEWVAENGRAFEYIGYVRTGGQVAVRLG